MAVRVKYVIQHDVNLYLLVSGDNSGGEVFGCIYIIELITKIHYIDLSLKH